MKLLLPNPGWNEEVWMCLALPLSRDLKDDTMVHNPFVLSEIYVDDTSMTDCWSVWFCTSSIYLSVVLKKRGLYLVGRMGSQVVVTKLICSMSIIACITQNIIFTMIPIVGRYRDPNRQPQARHKIDYLEHTRWILKDIRRKTHNLTWFDSNLTCVHRERIWESFVNKLYTKRSNLPLDDTRVFTFSLNLCLNYKSIPSFYASSPFLAF